MPAASLTVRALAPPANVGVAPITLLPFMIVKLWGTDDSFVNSNVSVPAFAVSVLVLNISIPPALAEIGIAPGADAEGAAVVVVAAGGAAAVVLAVPGRTAYSVPVA